MRINSSTPNLDEKLGDTRDRLYKIWNELLSGRRERAYKKMGELMNDYFEDDVIYE